MVEGVVNWCTLKRFWQNIWRSWGGGGLQNAFPWRISKLLHTTTLLETFIESLYPFNNVQVNSRPRNQNCMLQWTKQEKSSSCFYAPWSASRSNIPLNVINCHVSTQEYFALRTRAQENQPSSRFDLNKCNTWHSDITIC